MSDDVDMKVEQAISLIKSGVHRVHNNKPEIGRNEALFLLGFTAFTAVTGFAGGFFVASATNNVILAPIVSHMNDITNEQASRVPAIKKAEAIKNHKI